jgi:hypothetical protein
MVHQICYGASMNIIKSFVVFLFVHDVGFIALFELTVKVIWNGYILTYKKKALPADVSISYQLSEVRIIDINLVNNS